MTIHLNFPFEENQEWRAKTCNLVREVRWCEDIPLTLDGSDIRNCFHHDCCSVFFEAVCHWGEAKELRLKNIRLDQRNQESINNVLRSNSSLERLSITNGSFEDEGHVVDIPRSRSPCNVLQELTLERCRMQDFTLIGRILGGASIRSLTLRNMELDGLLSEVSPWLSQSTSLLKLDLGDSCISTESMKMLFQSLSKNDHLKSLTISGCHVGYAMCQALDQLLSTNSSLEMLDLANNDIDGGMISYLTNGGLKFNKSLRTLVLSRNPIGDDGVLCLVGLLISNPTIHSLSLIDCETWGPGCSALASGLALMKGLRVLYVDSEMDDFADEVLASLRHNTTLRHLWTGRNTRDRTWRLVEYYLHLNRSKRQALTEFDMPLALFPVILEGVSSNAALTYYFLRQKPDLVGMYKRGSLLEPIYL